MFDLYRINAPSHDSDRWRLLSAVPRRWRTAPWSSLKSSCIIPSLPWNDAICGPTLPIHPAKVSSKLLRHLERREMSSRVVLRLEHNRPEHIRPTSRHEVSTENTSHRHKTQMRTVLGSGRSRRGSTTPRGEQTSRPQAGGNPGRPHRTSRSIPSSPPQGRRARTSRWRSTR